ncbi:dephospho-CoA kinase [Demequina sp. B12]|uniref:dephospho-CoA kinase n=1 Tax=Demequina sp. B12 TaxID=2992757 RepID=UPI00237B0ADB|nr:dephospho-CoA kinase [Demequina sp. B12]MDE0573168.1 dephospho-CoA kinase [Demequina sp. B12]
MLRIGLTGGIAAGKSTASTRFGELGALVVDHDVLAREAVAPGSAALVDIVREFGDKMVVNGALDRAALADIVFGNDDARRKLNSIVHPYVFAMGQAADKRARAAGEKVVVHDIPLLVESGQDAQFSLVVTVAAPPELRLSRLVEGRGLSLEEARGRIASQATDSERAAIADVVLDGAGNAEDLRGQVDRFWAEHVPQS